MKKLYLIFTIFFLTSCSTQESLTEVEMESTTSLSTSSTTTTIIQNNLSLKLSSSGLTGSVNKNQVYIRNSSGEWTGTVGNYQFYLKEESFHGLYNWIGGLSISNLDLDNLIQANKSSGSIGTGKYKINISGNTWQGYIFGKKFQVEKSGNSFTGYGPKEVVFLIIIYSNI